MEKKVKGSASGIMLALLYYTKKGKIPLAIGAVLLIVGVIGTYSFGSISMKDAITGNTNPDRPNLISGISPLYTEIVFIGIMIVGLSLIALGIVIVTSAKKQQRYIQK
jgi:hypothetical protein